MLIDTSGFYCYLDAADANHARAVDLLNAAGTRLTHSYVLAELVALCQARRLDRGLVLRFVSVVADRAAFDVVWVDEPLHRAAVALLEARRDKTYSLCDAVSFLLMRDRGITDALTTDHHFEQEGLRRLLAPA
jgi:predicted nucleic acid-binding protein